MKMRFRYVFKCSPGQPFLFANSLSFLSALLSHSSYQGLDPHEHVYLKNIIKMCKKLVYA